MHTRGFTMRTLLAALLILNLCAFAFALLDHVPATEFDLALEPGGRCACQGACWDNCGIYCIQFYEYGDLFKDLLNRIVISSYYYTIEIQELHSEL